MIDSWNPRQGMSEELDKRRKKIESEGRKMEENEVKNKMKIESEILRILKTNNKYKVSICYMYACVAIVIWCHDADYFSVLTDRRSHLSEYSVWF